MDATETLTARVLRSGNDAEALGTHSASWADMLREDVSSAVVLPSSPWLRRLGSLPSPLGASRVGCFSLALHFQHFVHPTRPTAQFQSMANVGVCLLRLCYE